MTDETRKREQYENEYDRQYHIRKYAATAAQIINNAAEEVPREKIAALAGDVGRKLKHYATKNQSASTIYNDVRRQPIESDNAELSSIIAIRAHVDITMIRKVAPALTKKFLEEMPLNCPDIDSYITAKIQSLRNSPYQPAQKFKESHMKKPGHWGQEIHNISGVANIEDHKRTLIPPIEGGEAVMTLNQWRIRENESRQDQNEKWERLLTAMMRGEIRESAKLKRLDDGRGPPIIEELDQIDITCVAARHGTKEHMNATMGRQASLLRFRHRTQNATPSANTPPPPKLYECPKCYVKAEWVDSIIWHWQTNHEEEDGLFEESAEGEWWADFHTWRGTRRETRCLYCYRSDDWEEIHSTKNVTPGSGICYTELTAREHEIWHRHQLDKANKRARSASTDNDDAESEIDQSSPKRQKADFDFTLIHIENRGPDMCPDCYTIAASYKDLVECIHHWTEKHGEEMAVHSSLVPDMEAFEEYLQDADVVCEFCPEDGPLHMDQRSLAIHQKRQHDDNMGQASAPGLDPCMVPGCDTMLDNIGNHMNDKHADTHFHCEYCLRKTGTSQYHLRESRATHLVSHIADFPRDPSRNYDPVVRQEPLLMYLQLENDRQAANTRGEIGTALRKAWKTLQDDTDEEKAIKINKAYRMAMGRQTAPQKDRAFVSGDEALIRAEIANVPETGNEEAARGHWMTISVQDMQDAASGNQTRLCDCQINNNMALKDWIAHFKESAPGDGLEMSDLRRIDTSRRLRETRPGLPIDCDGGSGNRGDTASANLALRRVRRKQGSLQRHVQPSPSEMGKKNMLYTETIARQSCLQFRKAAPEPSLLLRLPLRNGSHAGQAQAITPAVDADIANTIPMKVQNGATMMVTKASVAGEETYD
ncbi:hypothetical protein CH63R_08837 [Colletotrichum higginsianum IMI 349063]|uniref:Uncharacterized protein n=1 Tax=Colletotrichum higginsianum (strain IMI 349063) TaxID=759273 RepID=A0A1B7Y5Q9_COLHI|nr:hypothetical protein CH63R_08837 [Colletotrichum higginsianum IMI 349063]OBR07316.1 hypothetical protein CH63R_08837 [Colletotrichum higginsianum IMI 349063]